MGTEIPRFISREKEEDFRRRGLVRFSFPELKLAEQFLPGLEKEITWLREQVAEGSLDGSVLAQANHTAYVDIRTCPQFLQSYARDEDFVGKIVRQLRESGKITKKMDRWGDKYDAGLVFPEGSRFGVSASEVDEFVSPATKQLLDIEAEGLDVRLPTLSELLYMRLRLGTFPDWPANYAQQTREWTCTPYFVPYEGKKLGNVFVSGKMADSKSGGVHWWFAEGPNNRLPSLGFRLIIVPNEA